MKKITLIACAALVAGLLASCSNDAGVKELNEITTSGNVNSYLVKGTVTTVTESSYGRYNDKDQLVGSSQWDSSLMDYTTVLSSKGTQKVTFLNTPAYISFGTNEQWDRNWNSYYIGISDENTVEGYLEYVANSGSYWDGSAKKDYTSTQLDASKVEKTDDPIDVSSYMIGDFDVFDIDGTLYYRYGKAIYEVTADQEKIEAGEDFTLSVTFVTTDYSDEYKNLDEDGKQTSRQTQSVKTTVTYDLTFTAK